MTDDMMAVRGLPKEFSDADLLCAWREPDQ